MPQASSAPTATSLAHAQGVSLFTSESVSEGHPDKVCDLIADSILDAYLEHDKDSRVACEVLCKDRMVVLAGEIGTKVGAGVVDHDTIARAAIRAIGYTDPEEPFHSDGVEVLDMLSSQSMEIAKAVVNNQDQGAGDQGIMFGYASDETAELMPLPILLAHKLARQLADDRRAGKHAWLRPDSKTQVTVRYEGNTPVAVTHVVVSTQHAASAKHSEIVDYVRRDLAPRTLGEWNRDGIEFVINPSGSFVLGGPSADCGVTGRKIIVDTYGGAARHGGGAFSGKDASKVDRSGAYFGRFVTRQLVKAGLAKRAEIQVAYAIGVAKPLAVRVETFGTGDPAAAEEFVAGFDFRPGAIIERLGLRSPIYRRTTNYGHFGRPELPWEK
ncbi:MAG: methionine adenosyltransferase [Acidobacteriota bacterium]